MLAHRDQWISAFPLTGNMDEDEWDRARSRLERPFRDEVKRVHAEAYRLLMSQSLLAAELFELAHYACEKGYAEMATLTGNQCAASA